MNTGLDKIGPIHWCIPPGPYKLGMTGLNYRILEHYYCAAYLQIAIPAWGSGVRGDQGSSKSEDQA